MESNNINRVEFNEFVLPLLGQMTWGAALGEGTFVTMEFGSRQKVVHEGDKEHGEWHLWIYLCSWRIEQDQEVLAGSAEDEREKAEDAISKLNGEVLEKIVIRDPWDLELHFSNELVMRTFADSASEESWFLYGPGKTFSAGPGRSSNFECSMH